MDDETRAGIQYAVNSDADSAPDIFSGSIPMAADAGTYYVWWRVAGGTRSTVPQPIEVSIQKAKVTKVKNVSLTVKNGIQLEKIIDRLPKTAVLTAEGAPETVADIVWKSYAPGYDPNKDEVQNFTVSGTLSLSDTANYDLNGHTTVTADITTVTNSSYMTVTSDSPGACIYGDTLTLKAEVGEEPVNGIAVSPADDNTVRFTVNGDKTWTADASVDFTDHRTKTATLEVEISRINGFVVGENTITAEYNDGSVSGEMKVEVTAKELGYTLAADELSRDYDGTDDITVTAEPVDPVEGDDPVISVAAKLPGADAAVYDKVYVVKAVINDELADYYTVAAGEHDLKNSVTVEKIDAVVDMLPTLVSGQLTYNGRAQELVAGKGAATGGAVLFSTDERGAYSGEIPTGIKAGEYYVWWKVVGDRNHNDTAPQCITVRIEKATPEYVVPTGLTILQGETLSGLALPDGFAWKDGSRTADVSGRQSFEAVYTPGDTENYRTVDVIISVRVIPTAVSEPRPDEDTTDEPGDEPGSEVSGGSGDEPGSEAADGAGDELGNEAADGSGDEPGNEAAGGSGDELGAESADESGDKEEYKSENEAGSEPKTGDIGSFGFWIILLFASLSVSLITVTLLSERQRR